MKQNMASSPFEPSRLLRSATTQSLKTEALDATSRRKSFHESLDMQCVPQDIDAMNGSMPSKIATPTSGVLIDTQLLECIIGARDMCRINETCLNLAEAAEGLAAQWSDTSKKDALNSQLIQLLFIELVDSKLVDLKDTLSAMCNCSSNGASSTCRIIFWRCFDALNSMHALASLVSRNEEGASWALRLAWNLQAVVDIVATCSGPLIDRTNQEWKPDAFSQSQRRRSNLQSLIEPKLSTPLFDWAIMRRVLRTLNSVSNTDLIRAIFEIVTNVMAKPADRIFIPLGESLTHVDELIACCSILPKCSSSCTILALQILNSLVMTNGDNIERILAVPSWQMMLLPVLFDQTFPDHEVVEDSKETVAIEFRLSINVIACMLGSRFYKSVDRWAKGIDRKDGQQRMLDRTVVEHVNDTIDLIQKHYELDSGALSIARVILLSVITFISSKSLELVRNLRSDAWSNLFDLLDGVFEFIFFRPVQARYQDLFAETSGNTASEQVCIHTDENGRCEDRLLVDCVLELIEKKLDPTLFLIELNPALTEVELHHGKQLSKFVRFYKDIEQLMITIDDNNDADPKLLASDFWNMLKAKPSAGDTKKSKFVFNKFKKTMSKDKLRWIFEETLIHKLKKTSSGRSAGWLRADKHLPTFTSARRNNSVLAARDVCAERKTSTRDSRRHHVVQLLNHYTESATAERISNITFTAPMGYRMSQSLPDSTASLDSDPAPLQDIQNGLSEELIPPPPPPESVKYAIVERIVSNVEKGSLDAGVGSLVKIIGESPNTGWCFASRVKQSDERTKMQGLIHNSSIRVISEEEAKDMMRSGKIKSEDRARSSSIAIHCRRRSAGSLSPTHQQYPRYKRGVVVCDFQSSDDRKLSLKKGTIVSILDDCNEESPWCFVKAGQMAGLFLRSLLANVDSDAELRQHYTFECNVPINYTTPILPEASSSRKQSCTEDGKKFHMFDERNVRKGLRKCERCGKYLTENEDDAMRCQEDCTDSPDCCIVCQLFVDHMSSTTIAGRRLHLDCATCDVCGASVSGCTNGGIQNNKLYCLNHMDSDLPRCGGCDQTIKGSHILGMEKMWHPDCFRCAGQCNKPLGTSKFIVFEHKPYCETDYISVAQQCFSCRLPIISSGLKLNGQVFHRTCVVCSECPKPIEVTLAHIRTFSFRVRENKTTFLCNLHRCANKVPDVPNKSDTTSPASQAPDATIPGSSRDDSQMKISKDSTQSNRSINLNNEEEKADSDGELSYTQTSVAKESIEKTLTMKKEPQVSATCALCKGVIQTVSEVLELGTFVYHAQCAVCFECKADLKVKGVNRYVKDGKLWCQTHYLQRHGLQCGICSNVIAEGSVIRTKNGSYHKACFVCNVCSLAYENGGPKFYFRKGLPYCIEHCGIVRKNQESAKGAAS